MREKIFNDVVLSLKSGDKEKLSVLRMLKGAVQLEEIDKKRELTDEEVTSVLSKQIKMRKESLEQFKNANREDLVEKTDFEISILNAYMPEQLGEEEVEKIITEVFNKINPESEKDMGKIMASLIPLVKGKADMGLVNKMVKEKLSNI